MSSGGERSTEERGVRKDYFPRLSRHDTAAARLSGHDLDQIHLFLVVELNKIRYSVIEAERLIRLMHQDRHPMPKIEVDISPTQPLDPEVKADIDATP